MSFPTRQSTVGTVHACGVLLRTVVPRMASRAVVARVVPTSSMAPRMTMTLSGVPRALSTSSVQLKKSKDKSATKDKGTNKGKKKVVQEEAYEDDQEDDFPPAKGKGKGVKSASSSNGPHFDPDTVQDKLQHVLTRAQTTVKELLSRVGRPDPKLLEKLPIQLHHKDQASTHLLRELGTVGVQNNQFVVHCFDPADVKAVEKGVYDSDLELVPVVQPGDEEGTIRLPIPKPTSETRETLIKHVATTAEHSRREAREVRRLAMKEIKTDINDGNVGESEGKKNEKEVDREIKKVTDTVDKLQTDAQKKLKAMDVDDA